MTQASSSGRPHLITLGLRSPGRWSRAAWPRARPPLRKRGLQVYEQDCWFRSRPQQRSCKRGVRRRSHSYRRSLSVLRPRPQRAAERRAAPQAYLVILVPIHFHLCLKQSLFGIPWLIIRDTAPSAPSTRSGCMRAPRPPLGAHRVAGPLCANRAAHEHAPLFRNGSFWCARSAARVFALCALPVYHTTRPRPPC